MKDTWPEQDRATPAGAVDDEVGARPLLRETGDSLLGLAIVATIALLVRHGGSVDVDAASVLVALAVLALLTGWRVALAASAAGRAGAATAAAATAVALAVLAGAAARTLGPGVVVVHDVHVAVLGAGMLLPGAALRVLARRAPDPAPGTVPDDDAWLRRFRTALRARLVPGAAVRAHVAEAERLLRVTPAGLGHPVARARQVALEDRTARARGWWVSTVAGVGVPLLVAAQVVAMGSWHSLTVPVVVLLLGGAVLVLRTGWAGRPWVAA